ncbi:MAG: hypothetical protein KUG81_06135 [Gammaproteobacteria bacterium]|nr:hypothetical protein [Gammaproteobacteria bacterium]
MATKPKRKKKKFKDTGLGKFLKGAGSTIVDVVGDVIPGGKVLKALIEGDEVLTADQKEMALRHLEMDIVDMQEVTKRWESDMTSDSWLSKNVRPLIILFLTVAMTTFIIIDSASDGFSVKEDWISLLSSLLLLVYGAYFGGRSLEKIQKMRNEKIEADITAELEESED